MRRLVFNLQKPARYTGGEYNRIVKEDASFRMALCFPDLYEVGMSNHGIQILYDVANRIDDVACERVFSVPEDFERRAREMNLLLFTLETRTPLCECDLVGFNVSHELLYTNILQVLDLGHVPVFSRYRNDDHPIVIAGGESVSNPAPLGDFIDAMYIGDGEDGIVEIIRALKSAKHGGLTRDMKLQLLEEIDGVYVPAFHSLVYDSGRLAGVEGKEARKRIYRSTAPSAPLRPVVPSIRAAQDRAVVEVTRGCGNLCKFCHAGYYELPCRQYDPDAAERALFAVLDNTGYNELTLSSLSISDYRHLPRLLGSILPRLNAEGVSISFPSLRVDTATLPLIEQISDLRRTSLTFAVESASDELRAIANKKLRTSDLLEILDHVFAKGWRTIKLYFMIGLPGCEECDEAGAIIGLLKTIALIGTRKKEINVTLSPFVPKPHTPFQWSRQMDASYLHDVITRVKRAVPRFISIKNHDVRMSLLEGVMSRGDERLGGVIYRSYMDGCRLDSWTEHFRYDIWEKNLNEMIPDWGCYFDPRGHDDILPWDGVKTGFEKIVAHKRDTQSSREQMPKRAPAVIENSGEIRRSLDAFGDKYEIRERIRIQFAKRGDARYIPHLDFMEIIKRALRMARLPVAFTQGFNKRERISMGFPLPVGVESLCELCDVDLYDTVDADMAREIMNAKLPDGIGVVSVRHIEGKESLMSITSAMEFRISAGADFMDTMKKALNEGVTFTKETKRGVKTIDFTSAVRCFTNDGASVILTLATGDDNAVRVDRAVMRLAGVDAAELYRFDIVKTRQFRSDGASLMEIL